jgi:hypothetical protein
MNAILRSDCARTQAALAAALAQGGDANSARRMYEKSLASWSTLRKANSISAEDSHRSDETALALTELNAHR